MAGRCRGQLRLIEPAFDLMLLPLAFQVLLLIALVLLPWGPTRFMGLLGLAVIGMHIAAALVIGRAGWRDWLALAGAPFYISGSSRWANACSPQPPRMRPGSAPREPIPMNKPEVSILIVSFNTCERLRQCSPVYRRREARSPPKTIVVDNDSKDGSAELVSKEFPAVRLIRSPVNLGFARANNQAWEIARGHYLLLLNPDAVLSDGTLAHAIGLMDRHPQVGMAGGRLVDENGHDQPSARMFPTLPIEFFNLSGLAGRFPNPGYSAASTAVGPIPTSPARWIGFPAPLPSCVGKRLSKPAFSIHGSSSITRRWIFAGASRRRVIASCTGPNSGSCMSAVSPPRRWPACNSPRKARN